MCVVNGGGGGGVVEATLRPCIVRMNTSRRICSLSCVCCASWLLAYYISRLDAYCVYTRLAVLRRPSSSIFGTRQLRGNHFGRAYFKCDTDTDTLGLGRQDSYGKNERLDLWSMDLKTLHSIIIRSESIDIQVVADLQLIKRRSKM